MRPVELKVASSDASACINCSNSLDLLSIPFSLALQIFIQHEVVVNHSTQRLCAQCNHIQVEDLSIPVRRTSKYNRRAVGLLLLELRLHRKGLHVSSLSEVELKRATRLTLDQLKNLADRLKIGIVSVFTFLLLCSMGISQRHLAIFLNCDQTTISRRFHSVLKAFETYLIPNNLGLHNYTPDRIREKHRTELFAKIFPNVVLVVDGTYIYIQKSSDFEFQKFTYSGQKNRNLLKFLVFCTPSGRYVEIFGPYGSDGHHNDEWLYNACCEMKNSPLTRYLDRNRDESMCDRGFSRIQDYFKFHCPRSIQKGQKQLSTSDANFTRALTRFRNVIERCFGRSKQWKILANTISIKYARCIGSIFRSIACIENM